MYFSGLEMYVQTQYGCQDIDIYSSAHSAQHNLTKQALQSLQRKQWHLRRDPALHALA